MYYHYIIFIVATTIIKTYSQTVEEKIVEYFNNDEVAEFENVWDKHRKSMENAIASALQDSIGMKAMNVYIKKSDDKLARGYFHDDSLVQLILSDLYLEEIPRFWQPDVSFPLAYNVIKIQTIVSKMIVHADYLLLRNNSDIIYEVNKQNDSEASPFVFQQVQTMGQIGISLDRCILTGFAIVNLGGASVNLGHDSFKLSKCQYTVEIFRLGLGLPPVIAKYHPIGDGLDLNHLVMQPICEELMPKLQATIYSFVNTTDIFGTNQLGALRKQQEVVFEITSSFLAEVVRNLNKLTIEKNNGVLQLENRNFTWDDTITNDIEHSQLQLTEMVVTGVDTLYSGHTGGPYKISGPEIGDEIRFSSIQIHGVLAVINDDDIKTKHEFASELIDVAVDIVIGVNTMQTKRDGQTQLKPITELKKIEVTAIRAMAFSLPGVVFAPLEPIVTGYILSEVPKQLLLHLSPLFEEAIYACEKSGHAKHKMRTSHSGSAENDVTGFSRGRKAENEIGFVKRLQLKRKAKKPAKPVKLDKRPKPIKPVVKRSYKFNK